MIVPSPRSCSIKVTTTANKGLIGKSELLRENNEFQWNTNKDYEAEEEEVREERMTGPSAISYDQRRRICDLIGAGSAGYSFEPGDVKHLGEHISLRPATCQIAFVRCTVACHRGP